MKTVAITIPSLHRPDLTARCIESVQRETLPADRWKTVLIENEARSDSILPDPLPLNTIRIELPSNEGKPTLQLRPEVKEKTLTSSSHDLGRTGADCYGTVRSEPRKSWAVYVTNAGWTSALREPSQVSA